MNQSTDLPYQLQINSRLHTTKANAPCTNHMMRLLAVVVAFFEFCILPDVGGFLPVSPLSIINECRLAVDDNNDIVSHNISPPHPEDDIEPDTLLSQAYNSLTVKELRDLLRKNGAKVRTGVCVHVL